MTDCSYRELEYASLTFGRTMRKIKRHSFLKRTIKRHSFLKRTTCWSKSIFNSTRNLQILWIFCSLLLQVRTILEHFLFEQEGERGFPLGPDNQRKSKNALVRAQVDTDLALSGKEAMLMAGRMTPPYGLVFASSEVLLWIIGLRE